MTKVTEQEISDFRGLYDKFDSLVDEIIYYIRDKRYVRYLTGFSDIDDFGYLSCSNTFDIRVQTSDIDSIHDYCFLEIPWEHVQNDTWREYLDDKVKEDIEKEKARKQKVIEQREKQEYEQYLKLKEKYGNP